MTERPRVWLIEFICLLCGRRVGDVAVRNPREPIVIGPTLRCSVCGGAAIRSGDAEARLLGREPPFYADELPHRGRPSKLLVAARKAGLAEPSLRAASKA